MEANHWTGCYEGGWNGVIVPEAFAHPAKFSYKLTERMFGHAIAKGWLRPGDVVADPFGGVGCGGIVAAYSDIQWVGCELEQKFVDLAKENFELHRRKWEKLGSPQPTIIQGDSRKLAELIGQVECVVSSPPFSSGDSGSAQSIQKRSDKSAKWIKENCGSACNQGYGQTPGNLGNLKEGSIDAVVSSPPFEGVTQVSNNPEDMTAGKAKWARGADSAARVKQDYASMTAPGQLGNDKGPTFWQAAREIVEQCHQILRPAGHAIWVVKAFVRKGKRVDFPGDWRRLCESVGFETVCEHHAMLAKETTDDGLFGEMTEKTERKSFFRRLAESKGSAAIDYEVVLCMER